MWQQGYETAQHLAQLQRLNCEYGQGPSQPLDSETAAALLAAAPHW